MKISVIIPVYNVEKWLPNTIDSILSQEDPDLELLLINDGSSDTSGAICDAYAKMHKEIQVFHIPNQGVSNARNFGLKKATGDYVHFIDSDDLLEKGMYRTFRSLAEENDTDIIVCGCKRIHTIDDTCTFAHNKQNRFLKDKYEIGQFLDEVGADDKRWLLDYIWNKWYKKSFLKDNHLTYRTELSLGEDFLFNCNAFQTANSVYISKEIYYIYFIRNSGLVTAFQPEPWFSRQILTDAHFELYNSYHLLETNKNKILSEDGMLAFAALRSINSTRCKLNKREKKAFLKNMYGSKQMTLAMYYLKHSPKKLHKVWHFLIKRTGMAGIYAVILADKIDRIINSKMV